MHRSDLRIATVPVSGLQYSASPSLPTAVKAVGLGRDTNAVAKNYTSTHTTLAGSPGPLPQNTLDLYDRFYNSLPATEPAHPGTSGGLNHHHHHNNNGDSDSRTNWCASLTLPDALSSIGPSARRLLQLDAVQRHEAARDCGAAENTSADPKVAIEGSLTHPMAACASTVDEVCTSSLRRLQQQQHVTRLPVVPAAARTLPVFKGKMKSTAGRQVQGAKTMNFAATATTATDAATLPHPLSSNKQRLQHNGSNSSKKRITTKNADNSRASVDVHPPLLSSTITNSGPSSMARATEAAAPSLVTQLHAYIQRELIRNTSASTNGVPAPSVLDQLSPYREAFRALCSAFPAYASLMSDIQSAYDNVIQAQAELLTDAYAALTVRDVERSTNQELVTTLHSQVSNLQEELRSMEAVLETRTLAEEERQKTVRQRPRSAQLTDALELRRELDAAHQRIDDLEHHSKDDLEKIVILIGAVRECDRRLKEYERIVAGVSGQVSELDEFKRIAGEAQAELQLFRKKYADFVPLTDFQLMKEYLAGELEAAQRLTRRWRRTAAVRGTQLDVMQRRLATLEEERINFIRAAEDVGNNSSPNSSSPSSSSRALLTPRPSWPKLHAELPELAEYVANVGTLTTASDEGDDATGTAGAGKGSAAAVTACVAGAKSLPTVTGPKETSLQVEFLVQRVRMLETQLQTVQQRCQQQQQQQLHLQEPSATRQTSVQITEEGSSSLRANSILSNSPLVALEAGEGKDRNVASVKPTTAATAAAANTTTTTSAAKAVEGSPCQRRASRRAQHRFSEGFQASSTSSHGYVFMPVLAPPLTLPLVGLGYGPEVPVYLRASGIVSRRPVPPSTTVSLVYHFFLDVLPPYMDQQDGLRRGDEGATTKATNSDRIGQCLYEYLQTELATREDLKGYDSVAHLMMNLLRDGEGQEWHSDALHVLLWTVHGVLPPRVAVDAAVVVAQVRRDVRALAQEQQSLRLRRQALSECLQPVLELKSASELAELRAALGVETTFSVDTLCGDSHPFMEVLLVQECRASAELYVSFVSALSARATMMTSRASSASTRGIGGVKATVVAPPPPKLEEGDRVVTLADVAAAIQEVEPQTPDIVVRELSVNAAAASGKPDLFKAPAATAAAGVAAAGNASATDGGGTNKASPSAEESCIVVRLSDIVRAIAAAPLIRRSLQSTPENCIL